jgi:putative oxidoreductase
MAFGASGAGEALLLGRAIFALVLAYLALGNLLDLDSSVGYAASKGVPLASLTVPLGSLALLAGAASILVGVYPLLGAVAVVAFLVGITPVMHDFWTQDGHDRENEQIHFLKNVGLLGAAVAFVGLATASWPYALGPTL